MKLRYYQKEASMTREEILQALRDSDACREGLKAAERLPAADLEDLYGRLCRDLPAYLLRAKALGLEEFAGWAVGRIAPARELQKANLREADLRVANLRDANLRGADLQGADFQEADLRDANLRGADLQGADFQDANLRDANLRGADLQGANLRDANLWGANLRDALFESPSGQTYVVKGDLR